MNFKNPKKILSFFVLLSFLILPVTHVWAIGGLDYDNPNKGNFKNKKFILEPTNQEVKALGVSILGCVDAGGKLADQITGTLTDLLTKRAIKKANSNIIAHAKGVKSGLINEDGTPKSKVDDPNTHDGLAKINTQLERDAKRENCLNGIAYTLAKNQLSKMAGATLTWVQTGFKGDPLYVQNTESFYNSIRKDNINNIKDVFGLVQNRILFPYGASITAGLINSYRGQNNFADSMITTLPYYLANGATADQFASDFSLGGWNGWLALTQYPQNNPLGATLSIAQYAADEQARKIADIKEQQARNGGILDQQVCAKYKKQEPDPLCVERYNANRQLELQECTSKLGTEEPEVCIDVPPNGQSCTRHIVNEADVIMCVNNVNTENDASIQRNCIPEKVCLKYETTTPGSIIRDKLTKVINSPETQLELANGVNETLNVLFTNLVDKFRKNGLPSLSTNVQDFVNSSDGFGSNKIYDEKGNVLPGGGFNQGGGFSGAFDITRDLADINGLPEYGGEWDASLNLPELQSGTGITNTYYVVAVNGTTNLNGLKNWKVGEKAFFDGKYWTKTVPKTVLLKRGIISDQIAYVNQVTQKGNKANGIISGSVETLPNITPAVAELDYCIPGPNPDWQTYASDAKDKYFNYISGFEVKIYNRGSTGIGSQLCSVVKAGLSIAASAATAGTGVGSSIVRGAASAAGFADCSKFGSNLSLIKEELIKPRAVEYDKIFANSKKILIENKKQEFYNLIDPNARGVVTVAKGRAQEVPILDAYYGRNSYDFYPSNDDDKKTTGDVANFPYLSLVTESQGNKWIYVTNKLYDDYISDIQKTYGPMTDPSAGPKYLPMAPSGLAITKDLDAYEENTKQAMDDYKLEISKAKINKLQLCAIKNEVDAIVKTATERRNDERRKLGLPLISATCNLPPQTTYCDPCKTTCPTK